MYDELIYFGRLQKTGMVDGFGDPEVKRIITGEAFAQLGSIGQTEFYQAQTAGTKPEIKFKIADYLDYQNQSLVMYGGVCYKVLRTYRTGNELEITCYGGVRDVSAEISD